MRRLLEKSPSNRIKVEEALSHPWITEKVKIKIKNMLNQINIASPKAKNIYLY